MHKDCAPAESTAPSPRRGLCVSLLFGDSFVYGNEVSDDDAWCAVLEASSDALEVLNYGVGGYGLDQAFLRFQREGMALHPDVVLIGFTPDDLGRVVNVYRRFIFVARVAAGEAALRTHWRLTGARAQSTSAPSGLPQPDAASRGRAGSGQTGRLVLQNDLRTSIV